MQAVARRIQGRHSRPTLTARPTTWTAEQMEEELDRLYTLELDGAMQEAARDAAELNALLLAGDR